MTLLDYISSNECCGVYFKLLITRKAILRRQRLLEGDVYYFLEYNKAKPIINEYVKQDRQPESTQ